MLAPTICANMRAHNAAVFWDDGESITIELRRHHDKDGKPRRCCLTRYNIDYTSPRHTTLGRSEPYTTVPQVSTCP